MYTNQKLEAGLRSAGFLACVLALGGCSSYMWGSSERPASEDVSTAAGEAARSTEPAVDEEMTATEAVAAAESAAVEEPTEPAAPGGEILQPNAPKSYTVKRGDTLWDIASTFLRDPWYWPEVWYINPQVENPHLIYPGDVLALAFGGDGRPQIRLQSGGPARLDPRLRSSPLDGPVETIPYAAIAAFLSRPTVLSADEFSRAPHVVALRDDHVIAGAGQEVYVRNLDAPLNARYSVVNVGRPLRDPDDGDVIGYESEYTATALVARPGDPAKVMLSESARETRAGDRLLAADTEVPLNFIPRAPRTSVNGRIIAAQDNYQVIGPYQVVVINRGKRHGVDAGHVLAVDQAGQVVRDREGGGPLGRVFGERVRLPDERAGTLLIFKAYDRLAYGLVVGAAYPMAVADRVRNP